ncbi:MAG: DUF305 domain-containing protein [Actinobacteria bacterium]|nr:DUF305 domain-containing protein [Actinomycetota bacterium]MCA1721864.1 DUF305 domain-containing protein [Actinomycetota bacterium]
MLLAARFVVAGTLAAVALSACGGSTSSSGSAMNHSGMKHGMKAHAQTSGSHNDADVAFASDMVPHHAQAVEMADMALTTASDPEVKALAAAIKDAQAPEITAMTGWLRDWGSAAPDMQMQHSMGGTGMMSSDEMATLGKASGASFDRLWVDMMTRHHQGALTMARAELLAGKSPDAKALAQRIIATQTKEIDTMKAMATRLAG